MSCRAWPLLFVLTGCGSFSEASSGGDAGGASDAGADGRPPEGGALVDGGARPCPPNALCDAFEPRAALGGEWDGATAALGGTLSLDDMLFRGAPSSLHATSIVTSKDESDAHLDKTLTNVTTVLHARFAVHFASLEGLNYARFFAGTADGRDFELAVAATGFTVHTTDTKGALNFDAVKVDLVPGVWHEVDYRLVLTPDGSVTFTLDGKSIYAKSLSLGTGTAPANVNLRLGVTSMNALDVHYDDFSIAPD